MNHRQLKLGAVTMGAGGPGHHYVWLDPEIPGDASVNINWYIEQARLAEAAKFDLIFIVDSQFITADSPPHYLNRLEPMTLLSALAVSTTHLGLVSTMTTSYNDPFNVARRLASLELISGGRAGWNVVTSGDAGAAGNFSREEHYDYDTRYARGLEFVRVAQGLWDSYEQDAFPRDRLTRRFLDPSKQHALHHQGEHFSVVGPLNVPTSCTPPSGGSAPRRRRSSSWPRTTTSRSGRPCNSFPRPSRPPSSAPRRRWRTYSSGGSPSVPWTGPTSTSGTPPSSGGSSMRWCPSCANAASSGPSTRPARCAGTWASRCRKIAIPRPADPLNRSSQCGASELPCHETGFHHTLTW